MSTVKKIFLQIFLYSRLYVSVSWLNDLFLSKLVDSRQESPSNRDQCEAFNIYLETYHGAKLRVCSLTSYSQESSSKFFFLWGKRQTKFDIILQMHVVFIADFAHGFEKKLHFQDHVISILCGEMINEKGGWPPPTTSSHVRLFFGYDYSSEIIIVRQMILLYQFTTPCHIHIRRVKMSIWDGSSLIHLLLLNKILEQWILLLNTS